MNFLQNRVDFQEKIHHHLLCRSREVEPVRVSWYGKQFHGQLTANGETFNKFEYTAASPILEFDSVWELCYDTKCVNVRINDRGPYVDERNLDVSRAVAEELGFIEDGVVDAVILEAD